MWARISVRGILAKGIELATEEHRNIRNGCCLCVSVWVCGY
jgi:hypothetical protein